MSPQVPTFEMPFRESGFTISQSRYRDWRVPTRMTDEMKEAYEAVMDGFEAVLHTAPAEWPADLSPNLQTAICNIRTESYARLQNAAPTPIALREELEHVHHTPQEEQQAAIVDLIVRVQDEHAQRQFIEDEAYSSADD